MPTTGRKIRDRAEAIELLATWEASGEPMSTLCRERGLNRCSLSTHRNWLRAGQRTARVRMVEVELTSPAPATYRVDLGDIAIEVDDDFRADTLRRLVDVLGTC